MDDISAEELVSIKAIAAQAELEVAIRKLLVSLPNEIFAGERAREYLEIIRGSTPSSEIIRFLNRKERVLRLSEDQRIEIERDQRGRCAWCGAVLTSHSHPCVDHKFPIAFGGEDSIDNFQILCSKCNGGKGDLIHWVMGAPWFSSRGRGISDRLRYCVLGRFRSRCFESGCEINSTQDELKVDLIVPRSRGGSPVFDNLAPYCSMHLDKRQRQDLEKNRKNLRALAMNQTRNLMPLRR